MVHKDHGVPTYLAASHTAYWHSEQETESAHSVNVTSKGLLHLLRCTMAGPVSSYSCFDTQKFWKVASKPTIDPHIQALYARSGGAITVIYI